MAHRQAYGRLTPKQGQAHGASGPLGTFTTPAETDPLTVKSMSSQLPAIGPINYHLARFAEILPVNTGAWPYRRGAPSRRQRDRLIAVKGIV